MTKLYHNTTLFLITFVLILSLPNRAFAESNPPKGWTADGSETNGYVVGTDPTGGYNGEAAGFLAGTAPKEGKFGSLLQSFDAAKYRGKRVRLSAMIKASKVEGWAGMWMRVDANGKNRETLAFDNMQKRAISGSKDWEQYSIVLDVPQNAAKIMIGFLLSGKGKIWLDSVTINPVGLEVPVTDLYARSMSNEPTNLDFED